MFIIARHRLAKIVFIERHDNIKTYHWMSRQHKTIFCGTSPKSPCILKYHVFIQLVFIYMSYNHTTRITVRHASINIFRYIAFICMQCLFITSLFNIFYFLYVVYVYFEVIPHHAKRYILTYVTVLLTMHVIMLPTLLCSLWSVDIHSLLTRHALHSFLISIMAKTSRFNPGSPNASDNSRMPTRKKKAEEDAKMTHSPKRRKATVAVTKRPVRSTRTTALSPTTTTTTSPQKRKDNATSKQRSLPLTRQKDHPELPPMPTLRPVRSTRTPAPSPPKVLAISAELDPFSLLDHTKNHDPPSLALLSHAAATINFSDGQEDDNINVSHISSLERSSFHRSQNIIKSVFGTLGLQPLNAMSDYGPTW